MQLLFIDAEMSGLNERRHQILSLGAIAETGETFYQECKLGRDKVYDEESLKINGLYRCIPAFKKYFSATRTIEEMIEAHFYPFLDKLRVKYNDDCFEFAGFNVQVDRLFLNDYLRDEAHYHWFDIASVTRSIYHKYITLHELCGLHGLKRETEHNALEGAKLVKQLYEIIEYDY